MDVLDEENFLLGLCAVILAPLVWVLTYRFEGSPPEVTADLPTRFLKDGVTLSLDIIDHKTGLRNIHVRLVQNDITKTLLKKTYPTGDLLAPFSGIPQGGDRLVIPVETGRHGLSDGEAVIQIQVTDQSGGGGITGIWRKRKYPSSSIPSPPASRC